MEKKEILYLSAAHVQAVLSRKDVIDTVEKVFCQAGEESIVLGQNSFLSTGDGKQNRFIAMPVSIPREKVLGLKWINIYNQPAKRYPISQGNRRRPWRNRRAMPDEKESGRAGSDWLRQSGTKRRWRFPGGI